MLQQTKLKYDNELNIGVPSNMAVPNCNFNVLKSHDKEFLSQIQPQNISGYTYLNKLSSNNSDFHPVKYGKKIGYTSADPRLLIKTRGTSLILDKPPFDTSISLKDAYTDPSLDEYGKKYNSYNDITGGEITYYIDKSIEDAYSKPNFVTPSKVRGYIYQDPMGAIIPTYERIPRYRDPCAENDNYQYCLSWMDDTTAHREDIMARQMAVRNSQKWSARWGNK